jgi:4-alpha-glucanotransferase
MPPELKGNRAWGVSVNLYAVRSGKNCGVGDFSDLEMIVKWVSDLEGDVIGISPLHAIPNTMPFGISPYSPVSRLYKNFIYLDIEGIPEFSDLFADQGLSEIAQKELIELRQMRLIDYERVAAFKEGILREVFAFFYEKHFNDSSERITRFRKFLSDEGDALELFAIYVALWRRMRDMKDVYSWQEWPEEFHDPHGDAVNDFRERNEKEVIFFQYVQWLVHEQLRETAEICKKLGLTVGLYHDLAIGAIGGGSDSWSNQYVIGRSDVGAPPDNFSPDGQKWGFPPLIPERLTDTGYELFIRTIRKSMKYGGALRIDHALGLFRLFWIPAGMKPSEGAYVKYPSEDLLRIIALESVRNRTMVIAEDLGTIGENVREYLESFRMLSYRLFYFEREYPEPTFSQPERYPEMALCTVTTHDLPTLYGYWVGQDIAKRKEVGKYPDDLLLNKQRDERERDKKLIIATLKEHEILSAEFPDDPSLIPRMTPELCIAIYRYLAKTRCKLLLVNIDDIIGTLDQQNMPGTIDEYPNWRQKMPLLLEDIIADERFKTFSDIIK